MMPGCFFKTSGADVNVFSIIKAAICRKLYKCKIYSSDEKETKIDLIRVFTRNINSDSSTQRLAVNNLNGKLYLSLALMFSGTYNW
jgi:hypothetical protein